MPIVHYLFGSESTRREVYGEGLSMPRVGFLREYREEVGPTFEMPTIHLGSVRVTRYLEYPIRGLGG